MAYHNPFIVNGKIRFPENTNLVKHVEKWAKVRGDKLAYRFLDFSTERDGIERDILWSEFSARNRAVGARLQQVTQPGDRIAILCPQNLDYLVSFFGALYSGRTAVPLFDPAEPGHVGRLHAVLDDCAPSTILTTTESAEGVRKFIRARSAKERPRVIAVDAVPTEVAATWQVPDAGQDSTAYLQYTSGSTRAPTGVQISHLNLPTNVLQVLNALEGTEGDRGCMWLPFFHDMGLITCLLSSVLGQSFTFMTPAAFVRRPGRWIRELARKPGETGGVFSAAPNFAFEHAALRGLPRDDEPPLDLSNVKGILNGSEPVSPASMRKFYEAFAPYGLPETAIKPSYGLAEATLFVSTTPKDEKPTIIHVDRDQLNKGHFVEVAADAPTAVAQVSAGKVGVDEWAVIVDIEAASELPDGQIGEIWLQQPGPRVLGQGRRDHRGLPQHPQVADQRIARRRRPRRRPVGAHRRLRHLSQGAPLYRGPDQGPRHRRRPQPLSAGPGVHRAGIHQGAAGRLRGRLLGAGQSAAPERVRRLARRPETRSRGHLRAAGHRRRAGRRCAQDGLPANR
jgi:fatty acid CoA ligase FadD32